MRKPDLTAIRESCSSVADKLAGELGNKPNVYYNGDVVSWQLLGSNQRNPRQRQDSTIGVINPGVYTFLPDYVEAVTVLEGVLKVAFEDGRDKTLFPLERIVAMPGEEMQVQVAEKPVTYLCEYY